MKRFTTLTFLILLLFYVRDIQARNFQNNDTTKVKNHEEYKKFRVGSYGEMLFQHMDYGPYRFGNGGAGSPSDKRSSISLPRFVLAFDYKFTPSIILSAEIEFEYGGTGASIEHEYTEGGEYEAEIEKGGEVALEQFHITKIFHPAFAVRAGHMIVPIGLTNAHHEPIFFFGATRPEGETQIIPSTWHETGIAILGKAGDFDYQAMVISGLDPNGFDAANWIKNGKQNKFEIPNMTNPAYAARVDYSGVKNTRFGISAYYTPSTAKNSTKPSRMEGIKGAITILSADAQYYSRDIIARANVIYGNLTESDLIYKENLRNPTALGYSETPVAKDVLTYGAEARYNIGAFFNHKFNLFPFVRYEYYNSMHKTASSISADPRYKVDLITAGLNYYILPNLVAKADYTRRWIGGGHFNNESTISLGLAYIGWFFSK